MAMNIDDYVRNSPYIFHLTYEESLPRIRRIGKLESAAVLMKKAGRLDLLRERRMQIISLTIDEDKIVLTDQTPIIEANIEFPDGWCLGDLIEQINGRVFFWRGKDSGLLKRDQGHYGRYDAAGRKLVFLRVLFAEACEHNAEQPPQFCKYNSGAPRQSRGSRSPRGPGLFAPADDVPFGIKDVREVVFCDEVKLPSETTVSDHWTGRWTPLF